MATVFSDAPLPKMSTRAMQQSDVPAVVAIERESYKFPWSEGIFRDCVRVGYCCRVVECDDRLIGYGVLSMGAGEAHLLNVCVRDDYRTRGIGGRLLDQLFAEARAGGAKELFLEVRPTNTAAIRLYQTIGFTPVGLRRGYYQAENGREDAIVMRLTL